MDNYNWFKLSSGNLTELTKFLIECGSGFTNPELAYIIMEIHIGLTFHQPQMQD